MLFSLGLIFALGLLMGNVFEKFKLPGLLGMMLAGVLLGPYALNVLDGNLLSISGDLRQIALIIILLNAGLSLDLKDLKKASRPAVLLCFLPAVFEMLGIAVSAPYLLKVSLLDALIIGSVLSAVSPAVIVPRMIKMIEEKRGVKEGIPQMIMAGASVDDVFVIVMFTAFTSMAAGSGVSAASFVKVPLSIALGILLGCILGSLLVRFFKYRHMRDTVKVILLLSISFILVAMEKMYNLPFSALLSVMTIGVVIFSKYTNLSKRLSSKFSKLWVAAGVWLFVLVGAAVPVKYALSAGAAAILVLIIGLVFRALGVLVCLLGSGLNTRERIFCVFAYMPKATVQAAIGTVPLAMGLQCGNIVLTMAVIAIFITAPIGAALIDCTYEKWIRQG